MHFFTIGVYNSREEEFFNNIISNNIDVFCDIRQRRGVRGAKYKFVNSIRLQDKLRQLDIKYIHIKNLAPTTEIRDIQKKVDKHSGDNKRDRSKLGSTFIKKYKEKIITNYDFDSLINSLNDYRAKNIALFCVEEKPDACHRSIVGKKLEKLGYIIRHL